MKRYLSIILASAIVLGSVTFTAGAAESGSEVTQQAEFAFSDIVVNIGADRTEMNFTWYQNTDEAGAVYVAKYADLVNGGLPENAARFEATATAAYDEGQYSNKATATGLEKSTKYAYQIVTGEHKSEIYSFTTGGDKEFSFIFAGDPQIASSGNLNNDIASWKETLKLVTENEVFADTSFLLSAGDHVETYNNESHYAGYLDQEYLPNIPSVNVIGNHDASGVSFADHFNLPNVSTDSATASEAGNNYSFMYNDVLFMVINANRGSYASQKAFMEAAIAAHPEAEWKVVTMHQSVFGVAYHANQASSISQRNQFVPIFDELDIDVVLMGHDHVYCRTFMMDGLNPMTDVSVYDDPTYTSVTDPEGILYVTSNSASGSKFYDFAFAGSIFPFVAVQNQEHVPNVSKVYFTDTEFSITTYRTTDMSVVDTFTINKTPDEDDAVEELIEAIGEVTLDSEADITSARAAYAALGADAQVKVYNLSALTDAEAELARLKNADKVIAEVEELIDAIVTPVTLESETSVTAAREAYDALSVEQRSEVENYAKLTAAEAELAKLKADASVAVKLAVTNAPETAEADTEFTVNVTASTGRTQPQKLNALNFTLNYDNTKLELVSVTGATAIGGEWIANGAAFGWNGGYAGVDITDTETVIATAVFKVKAEISNGDKVTVSVGDGENTKLTAKLVGEADAFLPAAEESDEITLYLELFEYYFIGADEYKAIASDTKILAIRAEANERTYSFGDFNFYWSPKYGAYVAIVGAGITDDDVKSQVTSTDTPDTDVIAYEGDVTAESGTTAGDAAQVSEILHNPNGDFTDRMRFEADVYGSYTEGGAYVTVADAMWILYKSVGLTYGG